MLQKVMGAVPISIGNNPTPSKSLTDKDVLYCPKCNYPTTKEDLQRGVCKFCDQLAQEKKEQEQIRMRNTANALGGTKALLEYTKERFINKSAFEYLKDYPNCNIYIFGGYGTGKSHLGTALLRDFYPDCKVVKTSIIMRELRSLERPEDEIRYINSFTKYKAIMIDDIDKEKRTDFLVSTLYSIIEKLYMENKKGLIITSNKSLEALSDYLGDGAVSSRLEEMCKIINLEGRDLRKQRMIVP